MTNAIVDQIYERMNDDTETRSKAPDESKIQKFFAGKALFLTGATGFMGKVFVEKILRSCPDLKTLYVLVRPKKGVPPKEKMKKYFENFIFDRLKEALPNFEDKVVTITGDLQEEGLGISNEDRQTLINNVDIMVHNGATVKFDEIISVALKINVLATKYMLDLATECKHIKAFIYVSTAYSHCYIKKIEEKFYNPPGDLKMVYDMIASDTAAKDGLSDDAVKMLLGDWPNIYTFTKSMAEELVRQYGTKASFPCAVYRPSIVTAAYQEPMSGWVGNNNGPALIFMATGLGAVHAHYHLKYPLDLVPADFSINALIAAIYDLPERFAREKGPVVYNYGSSVTNPTYLHRMYSTLVVEAHKIGSMQTLWHPFMFFTESFSLFIILHILLHFFPAILADLALLVMRKKPRALSVFWFGTKHLSKLIYFSNGNWKIHMPEMMKVCDKLGVTDKSLFNFDLRNFDWDEFTAQYIRGVRVYVMKEPLDNILEARKRFSRMKYLHYAVTTIFMAIILYYVIGLVSHLLSIFF